MATSKIVFGFLLAGTLAACGGGQTPASEATLPADTAQADARLAAAQPGPAAAKPRPISVHSRN